MTHVALARFVFLVRCGCAYLCKCLLSQVSCNRIQPICTRCRDGATDCVYSRSGVIRRERKRKHRDTSDTTPEPSPVSVNKVSSHTTPGSTEFQSHLTSDIETTRGLLSGLGTSHETSLGALTSLSEACASVWHNSIEFDNTDKGFFLFKDQAELWIDSKSPMRAVDSH